MLIVSILPTPSTRPPSIARASAVAYAFSLSPILIASSLHLALLVVAIDCPPKLQSFNPRPHRPACDFAMAGSSNNSLAKLFHKVFTEGPLEELINQCDVITSSSLIGSSNLFLESEKLSATLPKSRPFGLPCILHSHPTRRPWEYNDA